MKIEALNDPAQYLAIVIKGISDDPQPAIAGGRNGGKLWVWTGSEHSVPHFDGDWVDDGNQAHIVDAAGKVLAYIAPVTEYEVEDFDFIQAINEGRELLEQEHGKGWLDEQLEIYA